VSPARIRVRVPFRLLWIGWAGCGFVWRGTEHQFYRDLDGSMGRRWTHHSFPADPA
jgi:hypothetical protein